MKNRTLIAGAVAMAALTAVPAAASAQQWRYDRDRDGRYERWERRDDRQDRRDYRRWERQQDRWERQQRREYRRWARGQSIPYEYRRSWYINDYQRYGYRAPPRGYGYYRTDSGDVVMAQLATGLIISLLSN